MPTLVQAELRAGPMPGYPATRSAILWLQGDRNETAAIEYWPKSAPKNRQITTAYRLDANEDYTALIEIKDLEPETAYAYSVRLNNKPAFGNQTWEFRTLALSASGSKPPDFTLALGSCAYINDPPNDRPGFPYGGDYQIFDVIAAQRPDFMLWLGDNIYLRNKDYNTAEGMNARYRHSRTLPELQRLLRGTHHIAIWDDHDYGPDNADKTFPLKQISLALFQRYWANTGYGLPDVPGIFGSFSYADADFFLLDDRYYRDADTTPDRPGKQLFGEAQLNWLRTALLASKATFKIIASGSQLLNDTNRYEGWNHFPQERSRFLDWLSQAKIPGVLMLSGDRHLTMLIKRDRPGDYSLYELTCSPLTARAADIWVEFGNAQIVEGTKLRQRNFCELEFIGTKQDRHMEIRVRDVEGRLLWGRQLGVGDLRR
jgi:alkaline phosphatase D